MRAIANPLQGLTSDSAYASSYLSAIAGPVVLVGHSYGGEVITNAAASHPNVKALVYVAALIPAKGESALDLVANAPALPVVSTSVPDGTDVSLDPDRFREIFAGDLDETTAAEMAVTQRPANSRALNDASVEEAFRTIPSWDLITVQDHAIAPDLQHFMATRAGSHIEEVDASHAVMVSRPDAVTRIIEDADRGTR